MRQKKSILTNISGKQDNHVSSQKILELNFNGVVLKTWYRSQSIGTTGDFHLQTSQTNHSSLYKYSDWIRRFYEIKSP